MMISYMHSKQAAELAKAGGSFSELDSINDLMPYPGVFSLPKEIADAIEKAAFRKGRESMFRDFRVTEKLKP